MCKSVQIATDCGVRIFFMKIYFYESNIKSAEIMFFFLNCFSRCEIGVADLILLSNLFGNLNLHGQVIKFKIFFLKLCSNLFQFLNISLNL